MSPDTCVTLTGNLLAETTAWYSGAAWGRTQRASRSSFQVGGKGINVSRFLHRLGRPTTAVCFPAGWNGKRCLSWLETQPFPVQPFGMPGETRQGWVVRVGDEPETTFLGPDIALCPQAWAESLRWVQSHASTVSALSLNGSVPGWRANHLLGPYRDCLDGLPRSVVRAADCYGEPLHDLAQLPLDLIKLNRSELETLAGPLPGSLLDWLRDAGRLYPVARWVVTDGRHTVWAREADGEILSIDPPVVEEVSPVGSGDAAMAVLLAGLMEGRPLRDSLPLAVAHGAANAASPGVADFPEEEMRRLLPLTVTRHA